MEIKINVGSEEKNGKKLRERKSDATYPVEHKLNCNCSSFLTNSSMSSFWENEDPQLSHSIAPLLLFSLFLSSNLKHQMGRTPCKEKQHLLKGAWSKEEDQILINYVNRHGEGNWSSLPKAAGISYNNSRYRFFCCFCCLIRIWSES